jgi:transposase
VRDLLDKEHTVLFAGWDWASASHAITIIDAAGRVVDGATLAHTEPDLDAALARLAAHAPPADLPVAIEATGGLVVDRLLAAGHPVIPVHATAFHAARPRWSAAGAKSDPGDSYKLADYLRTDGHRLRRLQPPDPATRELQALVRVRADHLAAKTTASNQLWALLGAHWPGARTVWFRLASPIALDFLTAYPTPQAAAGLTEQALAAFCRQHAYRGGKTAAELLDRLHAAPTAPDGLHPIVLARLVMAKVTLLRTILAGITDLERAIKKHLATHPKAPLLATLPYAGQISLAQLLAELGPILDRADSADQAAAEAGATPVTRTSGKTSSVRFRMAANRNARQALHVFADNARHGSPWAAKLYADARTRGKRHPQAIRILGRAWLRVIWACWHTNTPYDPTKHRAEQRLAAA